jgi:predicted nucleic acid-binding protein
MTGPRVFVDSNITLYLIDKDSILKQKAEKFLSPEFLISTQVIAENISVCLKKMRLDKDTTFNFAHTLINKFQVVTINTVILIKSFEISKRYQLSSWDALIIATAMYYNCTIVYSQDSMNLKLKTN